MEDFAIARPKGANGPSQAAGITTASRIELAGAADHSTSAAAAVALVAAATLTACGGGTESGPGGPGGTGGVGGVGGAGSGAGPGNASTPSDQAYLYTQAKTDTEAARFLLQAQFSASEEDIAAVRSQGYLAWLREQMAGPASQTGWAWVASKAYGAVTSDDMIWNQLMASPDAIRKRMALALSEIFVVSASEIAPPNWHAQAIAQYWDTLVVGVTGNFRELLENVTLNPAMGYFLNTKGNQKEDAQGRQPDENYAREVMQLMSIGLHQLNADGTVKTGSDGAPLDSYSLADVSNLARVFTGYDRDIPAAERAGFTPPGASRAIDSNGWTTRPMALVASRHSMLEARFLGAVVPANTEGKAALKIALDTLHNHPNVGPFIGRQLIQRLVTSNPSPAYVKRVADAFADNGAGVRGDMKSVFAAVLLDNEARGPDGLANPYFGRLREPMLRLVQWGRTFGITSAEDTWKIGDLSDSSAQLGQSPLRAPSVFNFFRPGYVPPSSAIASAKLVAPEFQLVNESSVSGYLNFMQGVIPGGLNGSVVASYTAERALVLDPAALVHRLNLLLTANQLDAASVARITGALNTPAVTESSTDTLKDNRLYAAVLLVMAAPAYLVQK
ncbi:uncharacterized protein (DUF1800 family) [Variovorax sp. 54]|uniref:DUF1800 domain-containing protein n=1 Tax=Variovorax sp. 54 TaxID=2035212 RepID=UPI000C17C32A|nr:DUF1800 family protein [Variovorax sp. 54]PIF73804.1 uncharacterized protein (DUF1800 family) [Variovorax sp. 54]